VVIVLEMAAVLLYSFPTTSFPDGQAPRRQRHRYDQSTGDADLQSICVRVRIAAVILLVAIIAATALTLRRRKDSKHFAPSDAVKVKRNDRVRLVKMKSESTRNDPPAAELAPAALAADKQP